MSRITAESSTEAVRRAVQPLTGSSGEFAPLLDRIGDARFVLIGEASHGTHEFYRDRARITKHLIREKNFNAVAVEADWPDAYRVNRYVRGLSGDRSALEALDGFTRFPAWMWRNLVVLEFLEWLRDFNDARPDFYKAGFYGLDLYSLFSSIDAVINYLEKVDPPAARRARYRYSCFDHFGEDSQAYGYATNFDLSSPCEDEVVGQLVELQRKATDYLSQDGRQAADEYFYAEQNARLVKNSERYYRGLFAGRVSSWNVRDRHMAGTLDALADHLERQHGIAKIVVWEHNSHIGDARATEMGESGEVNVGQLVREAHAGEAFLIGFSTHTGTVTAASDWGGPAYRRTVRPSLHGSYEALFHKVGIPNFVLPLERDSAAAVELTEPRLQRAIGVIYRPETERVSHYFQATLPEQFDAIIHFDETRAVDPLERMSVWEGGVAAETYPYGV